MAKYNIHTTNNNCIEVSKPNSSILVYRIPYNQLKLKTQDVEIANRFIVYILHGKNHEGKDFIYVGKSKNGLDNRPVAHEDKSKKWTDCYVLSNFKERTFFNDGTIQYIEDKIRHRIDEIESFINTTAMTTSNTANATDEEVCDDYIEEVFAMLNVLGLNLYSPEEEIENIQKPAKKPYEISNNMKPLFGELVSSMKKVNSEIEIEATSVYIKLMLEKNILCTIESTSMELKICLNAKIGQLVDPHKILEDVSNIGRHGAGEYRLTIKDDSKFIILQDFINQIINL